MQSFWLVVSFAEKVTKVNPYFHILAHDSIYLIPQLILAYLSKHGEVCNNIPIDHNNISSKFHLITTMRCCDQGAHIRERLMTNRSDLTLQGGPNQHGTHKPRRTTRTNHSPPHLELQDRPTSV